MQAADTLTSTAAHAALQRGWTAFREGWRVLAASLHPAPEDAWLTEAQLRFDRRSTKNTPLLMPIAAFFVALAVEAWVPQFQRTAWWVTIAALSVGLYWLGRWRDGLPMHSLDGIRARAKMNTIISALYLTAWCSMSVFLWTPHEPINHMLLILVLACSLAGTIVLSAVHPGIAAVAFTVHALFMLVPTLASPDPLDHTLAGLCAIYMMLMVGQVFALNGSMNKMLRLEHERADLVGSLKAAKEASDRERAQAVSAGRVKSQFLSNMNHELRTPMNAILGFSELIKSKAFGDSIDRYTEYAGIIHESGQNLLSLINDMLDLAKIEGGKLSLRESDVNLSAVIADVVDGAMPKAAEGGIALTKTVQRGLPRIRGDERGLTQIIANLVSNAVKFTPQGGRVAVDVHIGSDGSLVMNVCDTGIGIAAEDQAHVFERFGRGRHDITTHERGSGLGLAIVKGFAEAHDGRVALESELGQGTRVTVVLPAERVLAIAAVAKAG